MASRRVEAELKMPMGTAWKIAKVECDFHCWGYRKVGEAGQAMESVAICRLDDGRVRLALPEKVRFLEQPKTVSDS